MKRIVAELRPPEAISNFMNENEEWAQTRARQLGVVAKYVTTQALLHLPYYNEDSIVEDGDGVLQEIDEKAIQLGEDYATVYRRLHEDSDLSLVSAEAKLKGKNELSAQDESSIIPVRFGTVPTFQANEINNHLHYIRSARTDTLENYGLHIDQSETPYACVSFSQCKRGYQVDALNATTGLQLSPDQVLSMTRAFTFNHAPHNSMSKLFHQAHQQIKRDYPNIRAIVTALNPYTGFDGGIFTGSSYTPYALSPMEYWYNESGYYVPRSLGVQPQRTETPPIIWLAHGLDRRSAQAIEGVTIEQMKRIMPTEYKQG